MCAAVVSVQSAVSFLRMGSLRVVALPDPERLSARATLFQCNHTHPPQFAVQPRVSGRMGPERALLPSYRESTLTTGLSPLESLESHTLSGADSWCHLNQTAPGRSRTCLLTRAEAETVRLRVKPLPLQTAAAIDCFGGVVQSSRLTPLVLETAV